MWEVSLGHGQTGVASLGNNTACVGILTHFCNRPTRTGLNGCRLALVAMARLWRRWNLARHVPLSLKTAGMMHGIGRTCWRWIDP